MISQERNFFNCRPFLLLTIFIVDYLVLRGIDYTATTTSGRRRRKTTRAPLAGEAGTAMTTTTTTTTTPAPRMRSQEAAAAADTKIGCEPRSIVFMAPTLTSSARPMKGKTTSNGPTHPPRLPSPGSRHFWRRRRRRGPMLPTTGAV
jgi:hypothetical protein